MEGKCKETGIEGECGVGTGQGGWRDCSRKQWEVGQELEIKESGVNSRGGEQGSKRWMKLGVAHKDRVSGSGTVG